MELSDKDVHCIARCFQTRIFSDDCTGCQYCKYALECAEETQKPYFLHVLPEKLREITGVVVHSWGKKEPGKEYLAGSWMSQYEEILNEFTNLSFAEQLDILSNKDILARIHSLSDQKRETVLE